MQGLSQLSTLTLLPLYIYFLNAACESPPARYFAIYNCANMLTRIWRLNSWECLLSSACLQSLGICRKEGRCNLFSFSLFFWKTCLLQAPSGPHQLPASPPPPQPVSSCTVWTHKDPVCPPTVCPPPNLSPPKRPAWVAERRDDRRGEGAMTLKSIKISQVVSAVEREDPSPPPL